MADLIDRQALLEKTVRRNSIWNGITNSEGKNLEEIISELPPVNPQEIVRDCTSCGWSKDGHCAGTEECHLCMWESQYKPKTGHWIEVDGTLKLYGVLQDIRQEIESVCSLFAIDKIDRPSTDKEIKAHVRLNMILDYIDEYIKRLDNPK